MGHEKQPKAKIMRALSKGERAARANVMIGGTTKHKDPFDTDEKKIAELRKQKGLSQQQLAKLMGTSQQAISRIESGEYDGFTLKTLEKIAEATGMRVKVEFVAA